MNRQAPRRLCRRRNRYAGARRVRRSGRRRYAVFTKSQTSPIFTALRAGASVAAKKARRLQVVHYVPSTAEQHRRAEQARGRCHQGQIRRDRSGADQWRGACERGGKNQRRADLFGHVNERLSAGAVVGYVGIDDAGTGARDRPLSDRTALGNKGNVAILDGPADQSHRARPRQGLSRCHQGISRREAPGQAAAIRALPPSRRPTSCCGPSRNKTASWRPSSECTRLGRCTQSAGQVHCRRHQCQPRGVWILSIPAIS